MESQEEEPMQLDNIASVKKKKAPQQSVYIPGRTQLDEDEELVADESTYIMLHHATTGDPCLSFEVLKDDLLENREKFPLTSYLLGGTQSETGHFNYLLVMKMANLHKTLKEHYVDDDDEESETDEEDNETGLNMKPQLYQTMIKHNGCVNRVKSTTVDSHVLSASWSENGIVYIYDVTSHLSILNTPDRVAEFENINIHTSPMFSFEGHNIEGYGLAWSKLDLGRLLTGDCNKNIHLWQPTESTWKVDLRPFEGHKASVEDIKWSPKENNVFMTCSVDKSLRVWDARSQPSKACKLVAHDAHLRDVNVIDWSEFEPLVISGGDDGLIKIWDLRRFTDGKEVAVFEHHKGSITSVEWNPMDSSVFIASGSDDQVTIWDVAVERDETAEDQEEPDVPAQLLFMHLGQKDIKEVHWHPQIPGLIFSTAQCGFNVFRTISV
ncbi:glutamate-rich WD repeat-containing protein 1 [Biomphalaria pfeifferi]|uniref:Glutamate-rich WD repeat-containing protein 1 n=1 Tax=Biomphalaria pfeifferi TaxID=112525 RepID=A0AAD8BKT8_BIOPF|nr:glutamate-rich WD repeat-containing protein 1 [Biomphalaria pfeifferi]